MIGAEALIEAFARLDMATGPDVDESGVEEWLTTNGIDPEEFGILLMHISRNFAAIDREGPVVGDEELVARYLAAGFTFGYTACLMFGK